MSVRRSVKRYALGLLAALTVIAGSLVMLASSASAATGLTRGPGMVIRGEWTAVDRMGATSVVCIDPPKSAATPTGSVIVSTIPGMTTTRSWQVAYLTTHYLRRTNAGQPYAGNGYYGAAVRIAVLGIIGHPKYSYLMAGAPAAVRSYVSSMINNTRAYYGKYAVVVKRLNSPYPGQAGKVQVYVKSTKTNRILPNQTVRLSGSSVHLSASVVSTGAKGVATVKFVPLKYAALIKINGTAVNMSSTYVRLWTPPSASHQRYVSMAPFVSVTGYTAYQKSAGAPSASYACSTECDGKPPVTFRVVNPALALTTKFYFFDNGVAVKTIQLNRTTGTKYGTVTVKIADGHRVTRGYRSYDYVHRVWSPLIMFAGGFTVDCPPWPSLQFSGSTSCTSAGLVVWLPLNKTTHAQQLLVNGAAVYTTKPGETGAQHSVSVPCGSTTTVGVAIQRTAGTWNGGTVLTIGAQG